MRAPMRAPKRITKTFQPDFVPKIISLSKITTIRGFPKRPGDMPAAKDILDFRQWSDKPYRSKQLRIATAEIVRVEEMELAPHFIAIGDQVTMERADLDGYARNDGFGDWKSLILWFRLNHGTDRFTGIIIEWDPATLTITATDES